MLTGKKGVGYKWNCIYFKWCYYANEHHLENLIAIDNTASATFCRKLYSIVDSSFDLISSNKVANTLSYGFIKTWGVLEIEELSIQKLMLGAGLPLIDTIKLLHLSGEEYHKIKGFSLDIELFV
jgi:aspartokinase/homoserine dehydrogenase 1